MPRQEPRRLPPNWGGRPPSPLGEHHAYEAAGTVAAPLLAGFSLTTAVAILKDHAVVGHPAIALVAFVLATGLMLAALQATFSLRLYYWTRQDAEPWFENPMPEGMAAAYSGMHVRDMEAWRRWRLVAHVSYNLGVLSFLAGMIAVLTPRETDGCAMTVARWTAAGLATVFLVLELSWWGQGIYRRAVPSRSSPASVGTTRTEGGDRTDAVE